MKKHHNTAMAHSAKPHKKRPFRLLALLAMMALAPALWAQNPVYPAYPTPAEFENMREWDGTTTNGDFKITGEITVTTYLSIGTGNTLKLFPMKTPNGPQPTIIKGNENDNIFWVHGEGKLFIIGNEDNKLNFYGNCGNGTATNPTPIPTQTTYQGPAIYCESGTPEVGLKYVEFYGFITHTDIRPYPYSDSQGGIVTMGHHQQGDANGVCNMDHVTFRDNFGGPIDTDSNTGFGRIISFVNDSWTVTLDSVTIRDCIISEKLHGDHYSIGGMGSAIRSQGNVGGSLTMRNCEAYNNTYRDLSRHALSSYSQPRWGMDSINAQPLSGQGGVVNWRSGRQNNSGGDAFVSIQDCYFHNNSARCGGAVATCAFINMDGTEICYNEAEQGGGVYFYTYNGTDGLYDGNGFRATFEGGVNIHHNTATKYGGGVYLTFDASDDVGFTPGNVPMRPEFSLNINAGSTIHNNKAPKGSGIALVDGCPYSHYYSDITRWSSEYQRTVNLNGGKVYNNYAQGTEGYEMAGGGIYIEKYEYSGDHPLVGFHKDYTDNPDPLAHNNSGTLTVNLARGEIYNNSAVNDSTAVNDSKPGYGGGVYIASIFTADTIVSNLNVNIGEAGKDLQIYKNQANTDGGGVYVRYDREDGRQNQGTVTVANGTIGKTNLATGNKALHGNGGGICVMGGTVVVEGGNIKYNTAGTSGGGVYVSVPNKESTTTIRNGANISYNQAEGGGGVYVDKGEIDIIGSSWNNASQALVPPQTTCINNNTATDDDGGGVYLDEGRINIYGSDINNNEATKGNGGGIYTNSGDIFVWPTAMRDNPNDFLFSICERTKTEVLNNRAGGNGGGLNTHVGRFDVRFAQISNNTAGYNYSTVSTNGGNGGGLFCNGTDHDNGYTVRLLHCDLEENKAFGNVYEGEGITGRGGGVYLKHGSIFAEHCDIIKNEADINGGGLDNHSGELRVYGSYIDENEAKTGKGGGLYTEEGNIVVGPCDSYGYKDSKASRIIKNKAKVNGGGINNHRGDITIHGDRINENEAETGNGGGVYINEGNIFMYGGQINDNKADNGKGGGVYGGAGKFNIMERKANPIVEILEVEDIISNGFMVHYHLVDRALAPIKVTGDGPDYNYEDIGNLTHGIAYSTKDPSEWTTPSDSTVITYTTGTHRYVLSEGCVRIPVTGLSSSQLYHVKAYAKYTKDGVNYFDASPVLQIATTGSEPVVATGEASEITENSAKVTGKLFYEGDGSGTVTKGIRYRIGEGEWTSVVSSSTEEEYYVSLTGLTSGTTYQAQAYATKGSHTGYGDVVITFTTATGSKAPQGPRSVYPAVEENPFFMELTPLQQAILASTPEADSTTAAPAIPAKTHRDDPQAQPPVDIPEINKNSAKFGGGICIDLAGAELVFSGRRGEVQENDTLGQINLNYASEAGGGIYIGRESADNYAQMQMMGKCEVNKNRVPAGKLGGGIYLDGRFYVGDKDTDTIGTHGLKVDKNFAIDKDQATFETELNAVIADTATEVVKAQYGPKTMNNVFLPRNEYDYYEHDDAASTATYNKVSVITLLSDISGYADEEDQADPYSHIGFSVLNGFCPVIATSNRFGGDYVVHNYERTTDSTETWLYHLMGMSITDNISGNDSTTVDALRGAIFEDSESYVAVHTRHDMAPFRNKYIYLWGCWTHPVVMKDPESLQPMEGAKQQYADNPSDDPKWLGHYVIKNPGQNTDSDTGDPLEWEIYSAEGLAWFTSYVNGLNAFDQKDGGDTIHRKWRAARNPKANVKIMNDLDMSAYLWVPIGSVQKFYLTALASNDGSSLFVDSETQVKMINPEDPEGPQINDGAYSKDAHYYQGTFDGQGHIIKGIQGLYLTGIRKFGLFGYLAEGAVVKNTFVDEGLFVSDDENITYHAGGIAGTMQKKTGTAPVLSNSEARMTLNATFSADNSAVGGLVGEVKAGNIHSCMAMPTFIGTTENMGGVAGKLAAGTSIRNCFTNVLFPSSLSYRVGGIVGNNSGIVENVYVRYNNATNTPDPDKDKFYWIAGTNSTASNLKYCFTPDGKTGSGQWFYTHPSAATLRRTYQPTNLVSSKYGFAHQDQVVATFGGDNDTLIQNAPMDNDGNLFGLVASLNNWVNADANSAYGYTPWMRTMASSINDDYPVLMFADFNVVGSEDGIYMKYDDNANDMWKQPNPESLSPAEKTGKGFQSLTAADNPKAAMYLYKTNPNAINIDGNTAVPLHIEQHMGITQATGTEELTARVGVTFDNSKAAPTQGGNFDWHMFSPALKAAPMGLTYFRDVTNYPVGANYAALVTDGITDDNYRERAYMDPPRTEWNTEAGTIGYFPTNTPYGSSYYSGSVGAPQSSNEVFDFYCFDEPSCHWINFKREGVTGYTDHWHQNPDREGMHHHIDYVNETTMRVGKGYMMSVSKPSILMTDGVLNNGSFEADEFLRNTLHYDYGDELRGVNLVGNPYQSYLSFDALATDNECIGGTFYIYDEDELRYMSYTKGASDNVFLAPAYLHPHQGFLVRTSTDSVKLRFNNTMRFTKEEAGAPHFRNEKMNYPLVNLLCYSGEQLDDVTTVELNRPEQGGGYKLKSLYKGNSLLHVRMSGEDYQTAFTEAGTAAATVCFDALSEGNFTMRWQTMHGDFSYLHLIDHLTGLDIDCLRQNEYHFQGKPSDYNTRFKLVFEATDVEEHDDASANATTFAYFDGSAWMVTGSGRLDFIDLQGRVLHSTDLADGQTHVSLPKVATGMYLLRMTNQNGMKVQKIIVR